MKLFLNNGFSKLEFIVVIILLSILSVLLLNRVEKWESEIERKHIIGVSTNIQSALNVKIAQLAMQGKLEQLNTLSKINPLELLASKPANYLGEKNKISPSINQKGTWFYYLPNRILVYNLQYNTVESNTKDIKSNSSWQQLRFKIKFKYTDNNANGYYDHHIDGLSGIYLRSLDSLTKPN